MEHSDEDDNSSDESDSESESTNKKYIVQQDNKLSAAEWAHFWSKYGQVQVKQPGTFLEVGDFIACKPHDGRQRPWLGFVRKLLPAHSRNLDECEVQWFEHVKNRTYRLLESRDLIPLQSIFMAGVQICPFANSEDNATLWTLIMPPGWVKMMADSSYQPLQSKVLTIHAAVSNQYCLKLPNPMEIN